MRCHSYIPIRLVSEIGKKRATTTRTRECENINIILQDSAKRTSLIIGPVRVDHERMFEVLDNDSTCRSITREAHRLRAISGTAAPLLPNKPTCTARAIKASLVQSCCKTSRLAENLLRPTPPRTWTWWKSQVSLSGQLNWWYRLTQSRLNGYTTTRKLN